MPTPEPELDDAKRRLSFDVPAALWEAIKRESADVSIAEGRDVSVSEVSRRRLAAAMDLDRVAA